MWLLLGNFEKNPKKVPMPHLVGMVQIHEIHKILKQQNKLTLTSFWLNTLKGTVITLIKK